VTVLGIRNLSGSCFIPLRRPYVSAERLVSGFSRRCARGTTDLRWVKTSGPNVTGVTLKKTVTLKR
jgi:hypothetical protein